MSNRKSGEMPDRRKPKVSLAMDINQGLGGPKYCPVGRRDGHQVNIPVPKYVFNGITEICIFSVLLNSRS